MELQRLIEAVESGRIVTDWMPWIDPMDRTRGILPYRFCNMPAAFNGSLDAAKALHDALLPGWFFEVADDSACVWEWRQTDPASTSARNPSPARAWLLAILKAYQQVKLAT